MRTALGTALLAIALTGCATNGVGPVRAGSYSLLPGQSAEVARNATLTYESYSDSRCPANAHCIWAGELILHFQLDGAGRSEEFELSRMRPSHSSPLLREAVITYNLKSGMPPIPRVGAPAQAAAYAAVINVAPR